LRSWKKRLMSMKKASLAFALPLAFIALLDNISTWFAVNAGAVELNPIVYPFLSDIYLFALFTLFKCFIVFALTYKYMRMTLTDIIVYAVVFFFFARAVVINVFNYVNMVG